MFSFIGLVFKYSAVTSFQILNPLANFKELLLFGDYFDGVEVISQRMLRLLVKFIIPFNNKQVKYHYVELKLTFFSTDVEAQK